jgi:hypothetical protein
LATFKDWLRRRLPARREILPVFAVIVFFVFSWSLYRFIYWMPSWLYYLSLGDVMWLGWYVLSYCLVESLVMLGLLLLLCLLLPGWVLREQFVPLGASVAGLSSVAAFLMQRKMGLLLRVETEVLILAPLVVLAVLLLFIFIFAWLLRKLPILGSLLSALAERMTVFLYIYVPLGLIGAVVVLARNLLR